jgi:arginyl-tRNA--protein-N-Asp/Glu arginylyltransferase
MIQNCHDCPGSRYCVNQTLPLITGLQREGIKYIYARVQESILVPIDMFAEAHFPKLLGPEELDQYLEQGWFRMGQTIFTTNFLNLKNEFYSAIWLRIVLSEFEGDLKQQKLKKINAGFRVDFRQASITPEKEELFVRYRHSISFDASSSLHHLLFGNETYSIYTTQEINVYDGEKLIAVGFFDLGRKSAAGISSFYDPTYKKHTLGKYLIYLKIEYCKNHGFDFFYPGYFAPGYKLFDYKLDIGKSALQYLQLSTGKWKSIHEFTEDDNALRVMREKLQMIKMLLTASYRDAEVSRYAYFEANLLSELEGIDLFDYPVFLRIPENEISEINPIVVFDVCDHRYHLIKCMSIWKSSTPGEKGIYSSDLLKIDEDLFVTESATQMVAMINAAKTADSKAMMQILSEVNKGLLD